VKELLSKTYAAKRRGLLREDRAASEPTGERMANGGTLNLEHGFPPETTRDLLRLGHKVGFTSPGSFGGYQAILWDRTNRVYLGASESRKDGQAAGY
jgi:gamma-glutamyltranspeptidase/glutathione hydrolase